MRDDLRDDENAVSGLAFTIARNLRKNLTRDNSRLTFVDEIRDADESDSGVGTGGESTCPPAPMASPPRSR